MPVLSAMTGGFPRTRKLADAIRRLEKRRLSEKDFDEILFGETLKNIDKASRYLDMMTDGMYYCDDILNPFIKDIEGVKRGWLVRFYDNNFFVRNPIVISRIKLKDDPSNTLKRIELTKKLREHKPNKNYRIPIPGPLTFAEFSVIEKDSYGSKESLALDYVENVLRPTIDLLSNHGFVAEIHDPSLGSPAVKGLDTGKIYEPLIEHEKSIHVVQYFNKPSVSEITFLTKHFLMGVDLVENPGLIENPKDWLKGPRLQIGIVNARNTRPEKPDEVAGKLRSLTREIGHLVVSTNTTLEFLPEKPAHKKIRILYSIKIRIPG